MMIDPLSDHAPSGQLLATLQKPMRALHLAPLVFCVFCEANEVPAPPRAFDLGDATFATFGGDGSLTITRDGQTLLASPAGTPLVTRSLDAEQPDAWHDPTQTSAWTFS